MPPVSTLSFSKPKPDGLAMSSECQTVDYPSRCCIHGEASQGKCKVGAEGTFQGLPQVFLEGVNVNLNTLELLALDCSAWPRRPTKGAVASKKRRTAEAERKQAACKAQATFTSTAASTRMCLRSGSAFLA